MPSRARKGLLAACSALFLAADDGRWAVEVRTEPSRVEIGGTRTTWWTSQVQALYRHADRGGLFLSAESQQRGAQTNGLLGAGMFLRRGDWTGWLQGSAGVDPVFVPRYSLEAQLGRRIAGTVHLVAGYQLLEFPLARVKLGSIAGICYLPQGELEWRIRQGRNETFAHPIRAQLFRWLWDREGTWAFGGTLASGRNLFDALAIPVEGGRGWTVNGNVRWRLDRKHSLRFDAGAGREAPAFRQRLLGITYRRSF